MSAPCVRLSTWLVVFGWILVVGGLIEAVDLLFYHQWSQPLWQNHTLLHEILHGPALHIGVGLALWALTRR